MILRNAAALILATGLTASGAAADPSGASLAAPGDCAQPSRELATEPVQALPSGVAGPAANHFAPVDVAGDALGLLPLDLTRVSLETGLVGLGGGALDLDPGIPGALPILQPPDLIDPTPPSPPLPPLDDSLGGLP